MDVPVATVRKTRHERTTQVYITNVQYKYTIGNEECAARVNELKTKSIQLNHDVTSTDDERNKELEWMKKGRVVLDNDKRNKITRTAFYRCACIP